MDALELDQVIQNIMMKYLSKLMMTFDADNNSQCCNIHELFRAYKTF